MGIFDTSERAKENLSAACLDMKLPMAPLSMRILMGTWLRVPLKVMDFLVNKLLISRVSAAGGGTSFLGWDSKRRLGDTGLRCAIFRGAWESLKIILFLALQEFLRWHGCLGVCGWLKYSLELDGLSCGNGNILL